LEKEDILSGVSKENGLCYLQGWLEVNRTEYQIDVRLTYAGANSSHLIEQQTHPSFPETSICKGKEHANGMRDKKGYLDGAV
ncbi:hypothetical protein KCV06_g175, partial [Aureobasidium melanogenum]